MCATGPEYGLCQDCQLYGQRKLRKLLSEPLAKEVLSLSSHRKCNEHGRPPTRLTISDETK